MRNSIIGSMSVPGLSRDSRTERAPREGGVRSLAMAGASLQSLFPGNEDVPAPRRGDIPTRKDGSEIGIGADICIRILGAAAIALSVAIIRWLNADVQHHPIPEASLWQLTLIAVAFLSASLGCGFVALGRHIYDRIEVSERWRRRF